MPSGQYSLHIATLTPYRVRVSGGAARFPEFRAWFNLFAYAALLMGSGAKSLAVTGDMGGSRWHQFQIYYLIILLVAVFVMDYLVAFQLPTKMLLHDHTVFESALAIDAEYYVPLGADGSPNVIVDTFPNPHLNGTIPRAILTPLTICRKFFATRKALFDVWHVSGSISFAQGRS